MKYTVLWVPAAEQELAAVWMASANRTEVTAAARRIDVRLSKDPESAGESRENDRRILLAAPLGVLFRVSPDDRIVHVLTVWQFD
jgi:hypothetical protein